MDKIQGNEEKSLVTKKTNMLHLEKTNATLKEKLTNTHLTCSRRNMLHTGSKNHNAAPSAKDASKGHSKEMKLNC